jgi:isopenicillin-N epimerase
MSAPLTIGEDVPDNPLWGPDWGDVRAHWILDPSVTFLNHGSFGACPRPVLGAQDRWREEMERQPVEFLWRRLPGLLEVTREAVATFLGADPGGLVFVRNATSGVATILAALGLSSGQRILTTDHAYPAVLNAVRRSSSAVDAAVDLVRIPLPLPPPAEIADRVARAITPSTRLAVIDHVTSPTAAIFPIDAIVSVCRNRHVPILVDGAHVPGMVAADLTALGADFWTGNFHKWVCAPKGSAGLFVSPDHRDLLPMVTSHQIEGTYHQRFDWLGTDDPTPWLATSAALEFMETLSWDRLTSYNHDLALLGQRLVSEALGTEPPVPGHAIGSMALVALPDGVGTTREAALAVQARLYDLYRIEVPFVSWNGRGYLRLSAQAYNHPAEYERLAEALVTLLAR